MTVITDTLKKEFDSYKIGCSEEALNKFERYSDMLIEWNQKINLTAITDPYDIAIKHFLDSALLLDAYNIADGSRVIDVGTGAGFPGIPLKILREDINLTLLDSLNKRLIFLEKLGFELEMNNEVIHLRAEEGSRKQELREKFDVATSRAVAPLNVLLEYCLPYVKVGGAFIAMKGPNVDKEIKVSQNATKILGAKLAITREYTLPGGDKRYILVFKKTKNNSDKYPRHGSKIQKYPL